MVIRYVRRDADPSISVVVPTVPGADADGLVRRLLDQSVDYPYEVLFVVDETIGRSAARNRGLRAARADVVAFTDDDCLPAANWLATIRASFASDPELVCLEGSVHGGCRYRGTRRYLTANLAVDRTAALEVGGFDESLHWREDTEFGWRMERDADGRCRFRADLRVCHPTVPRTRPDPECERHLRESFPDRYEELVGTTVGTRLALWARRTGVSQSVNGAINAVRRRFGPLCPVE